MFINNNLYNTSGVGRLTLDDDGDITTIDVVNNCVKSDSNAIDEWNWGCDAATSGNISADPGWSNGHA